MTRIGSARFPATITMQREGLMDAWDMYFVLGTMLGSFTSLLKLNQSPWGLPNARKMGRPTWSIATSPSQGKTPLPINTQVFIWHLHTGMIPLFCHSIKMSHSFAVHDKCHIWGRGDKKGILSSICPLATRSCLLFSLALPKRQLTSAHTERDKEIISVLKSELQVSISATPRFPFLGADSCLLLPKLP